MENTYFPLSKKKRKRERMKRKEEKEKKKRIVSPCKWIILKSIKNINFIQIHPGFENLHVWNVLQYITYNLLYVHTHMWDYLYLFYTFIFLVFTFHILFLWICSWSYLHAFTHSFQLEIALGYWTNLHIYRNINAKKSYRYKIRKSKLNTSSWTFFK